MRNQKLNLFNLLFLKSLFTFLCLSACDTSNEKQAERTPNVLFILVDDLGVHDLGYTGSEFYETPNVDRLSREGMIFTQGYATSRVCSPSRASILTGKFTATHGVTDWIGAKSGEAWFEANPHSKILPPDYVRQLPADEITLPEAMAEAGYKTFFAGKWHLGSEGSYPEDHGFDINIGGWDRGNPNGGYFSPFKNPKLEDKNPGENLSMRLAKETVEFMKANKHSNFFAMLSFYAVHGPIQTTEHKWEKYRNRAEQLGIEESGFEMERRMPIRIVQDNPVYAGLVEHMDDAVGVVLKALDSLGIADNTIVVFTSDNGGVASGDAFSTSNLPLRGGKGYQWEGGIREPYIIKVPWMQKQGTSSDYPVSGHDFYPTILDLANIAIPEEQQVDGISLKPVFEGQPLPERSLYWHYPHYGNQGGDPASVVRKGDLKLIHYWEDDSYELYNLNSDPQELQNLATEDSETAKRMDKELLDWLRQVGAPFPEKVAHDNEELVEKRYLRMKHQYLPALEKQRMEMLSEDYAPNDDWWESKLTKD